MSDPLIQSTEARRDDLIALTQDLICIPTLNPPGDNYHAICAYLNARFSAHEFTTEMIRARGAPADSETHPRWNLVARREGSHAGEYVHFNSHHDIVTVGKGRTRDPFGGAL